MEGLSTLSEAEANFVKQMELQIAPERQSAVMTKAQTDQRIELFKSGSLAALALALSRAVLVILNFLI